MMKNSPKFLIASSLFLSIFLLASQVFAASECTDKEAAQADKNCNPSMQDVQNEIHNAINEMISITGTILSGMAGGMQEGAEKAQTQLDGADGTKLIAHKKDLTEFLQVSVHKIEEQGKGNWRFTLAIKNANDFPVRLVNLTRKQSVLVLDADGFAYNPARKKESVRTITVGARTAVKATFDFVGLDAKPAVFRLFDTDFPVR